MVFSRRLKCSCYKLGTLPRFEGIETPFELKTILPSVLVGNIAPFRGD